MTDKHKTKQELIQELDISRQRVAVLEQSELMLKQAEVALRQSEEKFRVLTENSLLGIYIIQDAKMAYVNSSFAKTFGYSPKEIIGRLSPKDLIHPDDIQVVMRKLQERLDGKTERESIAYKAIKKDGSIIRIEVYGTIIDYQGSPAVMGTLIDITNRKLAEEALYSEKQRFQALSEQAPFGMVIINQAGAFKYINPKFRELFGYELTDVPDGKTWFRKAYPDPTYRHHVIGTWIRDLDVFKPGEKRPEVFTVTCKDGTEKIINFISVQLATGDNLMVCENITERKQAENALKESEERFRNLFETSKDSVFIVDQQTGRFVAANPSANQLYGYSNEEFMRMKSMDISAEPEKTEDSVQHYVKDVPLRLHRKKDGTVFPVEITGSYFTVGDRVLHAAYIRDITERKRAEEALKRSEEEAKRLVQENAIVAEIGRIISSTLNVEEVYEGFAGEARKLIPFDSIAINIINHGEGTITVPYASGISVPRCQPGGVLFIEGSVTGEVMRTRSSLVIQTGDKNELEAQFPTLSTAWEMGLRSLVVVPLISKDRVIGAIHFRSVQSNHYSDRDLKLAETIGSQIAGAVASAQLYSRLKETEESLRRSEGKFRDLYDSAPVGYHELDIEGRITNVNRTDQEMLGYSREELIGEYIWKFNVEEDIAHREVLEKLAGLRPPGHSFERTYLRKDGTTIPVLLQDRLNKNDEGRITGIRVAIQDITEQKRTGDALRESEERYRQLVELSPEAIFVHIDARIVYINPAAAKLFNLSDPEVIGKSFFDFCHTDYHDLTQQRIQRIQQTGKPIESMELKYVRSNGQIIDVEVTGAPVAYKGKQGILTVARDISDRKRAEEALRKAEENFRQSLDESPLGVRIVTAEGEVLYANRSILRIYGYDSIEELRTTPIEKRYTPESYAEFEIRKEKRQRGELVPSEYEISILRKNGEVRHLQVLRKEVLWDGERQFQTLYRDVTDRRRAEEEKFALQEQLHQAQKMESVGRLAGGVAHDFNNLLTVIKGYSDLSLGVLQKGDPLWENLGEIQKAAERAADLTRQLLAFSRRQILEFKTLDLHQLIQGMEKMLRRMIGEDIELIIYPGEDLGSIKTDPGQMEQVIMNLAVNARDAMPSGGTLILETENVYLDEEYARNHVSVKPGPYVRLSITDTGCGMTPEVREQVFEPFFTTKEKGKGTGLGLSTVYGIVKQSGGNIWVYSEPGKGTTLKIYLPRIDEPVDVMTKKGELKEIPRGNETVLVVEDEEVVRKLAVQILKNRGYKVLEAAFGGEALLVLERHQGPIHLILTDVVMPGMSGPELIERLRQVRKDFKVVYMSGYTDESVIYHGVQDGETDFIQKPFTLEMLGRKIREVLDEA